MEILHLKSEQLTRKILNILNELASTNQLTLTNARRIIDENIKKNVFMYVGYESGEAIAVGTLVVWEKLIHNGSTTCVVEDVAVKKQYQGKGYGKIMINHLVDKAKRAGARKIILTCKEELEPFYNKCGFTYWCGAMRRDLI